MYNDVLNIFAAICLIMLAFGLGFLCGFVVGFGNS